MHSAPALRSYLYAIGIVEEQMYTLEDDHETSSRLNKAAQAANPQAGTFGPPGEAHDPGPAGQPAASHPAETRVQHLSHQITASMRQLTTPGQASPGDRKRALAALTVACASVFLTSMDQTVVVTALPQIITDLQIPITQLARASWIISAYLLGFVVAMPLMGRVSDIYGRRRIFNLCLVIFGIGSILCGLAPILGKTINLSFLGIFDTFGIHIDLSSPGLVWLIAARLVQAIGGGALVPISMAIAGDFYGQERRGLALGLIGAMTEAGGALGPLYGALIVQSLGWQYIFYLNVPLVIALLVAAWILIPTRQHQHEGIDWPGALLLGAALTCLSLGLAQQGTSLGPTNPNDPLPQNNPVVLILSLVFLVAFVLVERRVRWPVVELSLFKRPAFTATSVVSLLVGAALITALADIPIFIDTVLQSTVLDSGLALLRLTAMIPIGALLGGWLCHHITCRFTAILGLLFTAAGFFLMSRWPIHVSWTQITISTLTAGLGFGLVIAPISTTAINAVRARQAGASSAVVTALRMVGMTLGLAALTSWALAYFKELARKYPALPANATAEQFTAWSDGYAKHLIQSAHTVYSTVFFLSMFICLIAIIPAFFLWGRKPPVEDDTTHPSAEFHEAATLAVPKSGGNNATPVQPSTTRKLILEGPPDQYNEPDNGNGGPRSRRLLFALIGAALALLLVAGGVFAALTLGKENTSSTTQNGPNRTGNATTATPIAGPRMIQLALDQEALTSIFATQLKMQNGILTDLKVRPTANDGLVLGMNLHIAANGINRTMPIELSGVINIDKQQNLQLQVTHLKRDGIDAGPEAAATMQTAVNQMLSMGVMPALRAQLKGVKLISAHTSSSIACGKGKQMLVLLIEAPPIQGMAAQPTPVPFCFTGSIDLNKLLPH
jgi:MFS family permease